MFLVLGRYRSVVLICSTHLLLQRLVAVRYLLIKGVVLHDGDWTRPAQPVRRTMSWSSSSVIKSERGRYSESCGHHTWKDVRIWMSVRECKWCWPVALMDLLWMWWAFSWMSPRAMSMVSAARTALRVSRAGCFISRRISEGRMSSLRTLLKLLQDGTRHSHIHLCQAFVSVSTWITPRNGKSAKLFKECSVQQNSILTLHVNTCTPHPQSSWPPQ